ncbi:hypothetical protein FRC03_010635 [Tulasnella sp. 419]|nr:hypothetical protein FRC02_008519 [Tulasnella sp. 418]KAG8957006.1 hypothetical protein FRC03_010635 [Tulasnella sp. 419]
MPARTQVAVLIALLSFANIAQGAVAPLLPRSNKGPRCTVVALTTAFPVNVGNSLRASGRYFGTTVGTGTLSGSGSQSALSPFNQITPLNSLTWDVTEPSPGAFSFATADYTVGWAIANNKLITGHAFIWHSHLPSWVTAIPDASTLRTVIQRHITTIASRYKGKIFHWHVVNEILNEDGSLRSSVFYNVLGETFIQIAFATARTVDPASKLYINDYNLDSVSAKTQAIVVLVKRLKAAGVPIDGIGTEAHLSAGVTASFKNALTLLATAGTEVAITELDISGGSASDYTNVANACITTPACVGITISEAPKNTWQCI